MRLSSIRINTDLCEQGVWQRHPSGFELLIARLPNAQFERFVQACDDTEREQLQAMGNTQAMSTIGARCIAETIVLDWRGVHSETGITAEHAEENGVSLVGSQLDPETGLYHVVESYTPKRFMEILMDPTMIDLVKFVLLKAQDDSQYRIRAAKAAVKS